MASKHRRKRPARPVRASAPQPRSHVVATPPAAPEAPQPAPAPVPEFAEKPKPLAATLTALQALDRQKIAYVEVSPCCYRIADMATFYPIGLHGHWSFADGQHGYGVVKLIAAVQGRQAVEKALQEEKVGA